MHSVRGPHTVFWRWDWRRGEGMALIEPEASTATAAPPEAETPRPKSAIAGSLDELGALAEQVSDAARALIRLALAETSLSVLAIRRLLLLRVLVMAAFALAVVFLGASGVIALANWLGSAAAALAIVGVLLLVLGFVASGRAKTWRGRVGYAETRAALRESLHPGGSDDVP